MNGFDPDKYLQKKQFDPDAYLAKKQDEATTTLRGGFEMPVSEAYQEIKRLEEEYPTTGSAMLQDAYLEIQKVLPNLKRLFGDDPKAKATIQGLEKQQALLELARPGSSFGGGLGVPVATTVATAPLQGAKAVGAGLAEAAGLAGSEDSPFMNALKTGGIMAGLKYGGDLLGATTESLKNLFTKGEDIVKASPDQQAARVIKRNLEASGVDPNKVIQELESLPQGRTLADVQDMRKLGQGVATQEAARPYQQFYEQRNLGQTGRIEAELSRVLGKNPNEFSKSVLEKIQQRRETAKPLYDEALSAQYVPTENTDALMKRAQSSGALNQAKKTANIEGKSFDLENPTLSDLHNIKVALDDLAYDATGARQTALLKLKDDVVKEIETQSPVYRQARQQFSSDSAVIEAADIGENLFNPKIMGRKATFDQLKEKVGTMSDAEYDSFQSGVAKALTDKLQSVPDTADSARRLWNRPDIRNRVRLAFNDDNSFNQFLGSLKTESQFTDTLRDLYQGSQTAARQAAEQSIKSRGIELTEPFRKLFRGDISEKGMQELARLMYDPSLTPTQLRDALLKAGVINESWTAKKVEYIGNKLKDVYDRIPPTTMGIKATVAAKTQTLEDEE